MVSRMLSFLLSKTKNLSVIICIQLLWVAILVGIEVGIIPLAVEKTMQQVPIKKEPALFPVNSILLKDTLNLVLVWFTEMTNKNILIPDLRLTGKSDLTRYPPHL